MHYEAGLIFVDPDPDVLEGIRSILRGLPVMIVKDYDISLYGAANAAVILGGGRG